MGRKRENVQSPAERKRKIRKGTFSCWECKRRKARCMQFPESTDVCEWCYTNGLECVGQDREDPASPSYADIGQKIDRVEGLIAQLTRQKSVSTAPRCSEVVSRQKLPARSFRNAWQHQGDGRHLVRRRTSDFPHILSPTHLCLSGENLLSRCRSLSCYLSTILPSSADSAMILSCGNSPFGFLVQPFSPFQSGDSTSKWMNELPLATSHPVCFARKLLQLALGLYILNGQEYRLPDVAKGQSFGTLRRFFVDNARHVTSEDVLSNSVEGLEALMLEGYYQVNNGNMHDARMIIRRALGIAQLINVPAKARVDKYVEYLWFRLNYFDRSLSLYLGLPHAIPDERLAFDSSFGDHSSLLALRQAQSIITGRIIARNLRICTAMNATSPTDEVLRDFEETQDLDSQLKQISRSLPLEWWNRPLSIPENADAESRAAASRLLCQMEYYNCLVLLHLPYAIDDLFRLVLKTKRRDGRSERDSTYNRLAMLIAGREVLLRFSLFRGLYHISTSYTALRKKVFIAATMILLCHIESHAKQQDSFIEHQRPQDLAIIKDTVREFMALRVTEFAAQESGYDYAQTLERLLDAEEDAANGARFVVRSLKSGGGNDGLSFQVPYFGTFSIIRQGTSSLQTLTTSYDARSENGTGVL